MGKSTFSIIKCFRYTVYNFFNVKSRQRINLHQEKEYPHLLYQNLILEITHLPKKRIHYRFGPSGDFVFRKSHIAFNFDQLMPKQVKLPCPLCYLKTSNKQKIRTIYQIIKILKFLLRKYWPLGIFNKLVALLFLL